MPTRAMLLTVFMSSLTTLGNAQTHDCVSNCTGKVDGNYHSCQGCREIIMCVDEVMTKRQCSKGTVYDASTDKCEWQSSTCDDTSNTRPSEETSTLGKILAQTLPPAIKGSFLTFRYIKVRYQTSPCSTGASYYKNVTVRSTIHCGVWCKRDSKCRYVQHLPPKCLMYGLSPPCSMDIYKYDD